MAWVMRVDVGGLGGEERGAPGVGNAPGAHDRQGLPARSRSAARPRRCRRGSWPQRRWRLISATAVALAAVVDVEPSSSNRSPWPARCCALSFFQALTVGLSSPVRAT